MNKFYEKLKYVHKTHIKSELNPDFLNYKPEMGTISCHIDTEIKETTLDDILESKVLLEQIQSKPFKEEKEVIEKVELIVEKAPIKTSKKPRENVRDSKLEVIENDSSKGYKIVKKGDLEFKLYNSYEDRKVLVNERGFYSAEIFEDTKIEDYVELFPIVDIDDAPAELRNNHDFKWVKTVFETGVIDEDFVAVFDYRYFNFLNPSTYGLCNGLLIVTGSAYDNSFNGFNCYRYYEGVLYYLDNINPFKGGYYHAVNNPIQSRIEADLTEDSRQWCRKYMHYLLDENEKNR